MTESEKSQLLTDIEAILSGIDKGEWESDEGWWETSTGVDFGAERLRLIRERIEQMPLTLPAQHRPALPQR